MIDTQTATQTPRWASSYELGKYLKLHQKTINRLTRSGELVAYKLGTNLRYDLNEVDAGIRGTPAILTPTEVLDKIRTAIPTGKPLIPVAAVLEILDTIAAETRA